MKRVIVDTGPLVAFLNVRDRYHSWAKDVLETVEPPLATCESVISEACFIVRKLDGGSDAVLELVDRGIVHVTFDLAKELERVRKLMNKFANVPMSLADACLVRMAELDRRATVLTLDDDFRVYRKNGREAIPRLSPD